MPTRKLFIIGNGFDCFAHTDNKSTPMKTQYADFKDFILSQYPEAKCEFGVPVMGLTDDHHGYDYDKNEAIGYIIRVLDECQDPKWSTLESVLGDSIYSIFHSELKVVDIEAKDAEISRILCNNIDTASAIESIFMQLKELFETWVSKVLGSINYDNILPKDTFKDILIGKSPSDPKDKSSRIYLTFNYTETLEKVYKIDPRYILHIHGKVGTPIYFGHGNTTDIDTHGSWEVDDSFETIREFFLKDTSKVIQHNQDFFQSLKDVREIYSFGFSFSDVDVVYINEICKCLPSHDSTWYFNTYDSENNAKFLELIKSKGFSVKTENKW